MQWLRWIVRHGLIHVGLSLLAVFVLYDFTVCTGITFDEPYTPIDVRTLRGDGGIRFVPLGAFPTSTLDTLAQHYQEKYGLRVDVAPPLRLPSAAFDTHRGQIVSDAVIGALAATYPQPADGRRTVIGFTVEDMYIPAANWRYAISYRKAERYAVVSTARLDRGCLGLVRASEERRMSRLRKMVTKNIGVLYYGLPLSNDPRSVLFGNIGGPQEFDRMCEEF